MMGNWRNKRTSRYSTCDLPHGLFLTSPYLSSPVIITWYEKGLKKKKMELASSSPMQYILRLVVVPTRVCTIAFKSSKRFPSLKSISSAPPDSLKKTRRETLVCIQKREGNVGTSSSLRPIGAASFFFKCNNNTKEKREFFFLREDE